MAVYVSDLRIAGRQSAGGGCARKRLRLRAHSCIAAECALQRVLRGYPESLQITFILNLIRLVVADFGAVMKSAPGQWPWNHSQQRFLQHFVVLCELPCYLS